MHLLETSGLVYTFNGGTPVLDAVSLQVQQGSIYGFLGPNGAGKTTTLRLILGLLKRQQGSITIFDTDLEYHRTAILGRVGSLIESPSIYSHLTAEENLHLLQVVYGGPRSRIGEVLRLAGIGDTGKKTAGNFSLGMKQRLAIAIALLNEPELLVLDEPTNGLDPNGMIEIRELLKNLNQHHGITILISSHLLSEIDRLVSHVGIINHGKMLFQGTLDELKEQQQEPVTVVLETGNIDSTLRVLAANGIAAEAVENRIKMPFVSRQQIAVINRLLVTEGIDVYEVSAVKNDLERIFIDMVR
jgi:ABC-type multidrug transport system ATPase subunit